MRPARPLPNAPHARSGMPLAWAILPASLALLTCEAPTAPGVCGAIPEQTVTVGESATVSVCFEDRDGAALTYQSWVSDPAVATITGSGGSVTATAVSPGHALVTIVVTNRHGLKSQQSFRVTVPNRRPVVLAGIEGREVTVGDSVMLDVSAHFSDPDGQTLVYTAESDTAVTRSSVSGADLTVVAVAKGANPVEITASDPGGMTATLSFMVTVPNQPPLTAETVDAQTLEVGDTTEVEISPLFMDPDGDALTYSAIASDIAVVEVAILDGSLAVVAAAKGEAVVTVSASDTEGLTAEQSFGVTVPNQPPLALDSIPPQVVTMGETVTVDLTPFFTDPDGDPLTFAAAAADGTVSVSVSDGALVVAPVRKGRTTITVTATDTDGVSVTQDIAVSVPNRAPDPVGSVPEMTLQVDSIVLLNASPYFADADGDALVYTAASSDPAVARATVIMGVAVSVAAVAKGAATVTVTATDPEGSAATQSFAVMVPNRAPFAAGRFEAQHIMAEDAQTLALAGFFSDPDGDVLTFEAVSSDPTVVEATVAEGLLTMRGRERGTATVTVTASDSEGLTAEQSIEVTVTLRNRPPLLVGTFHDQNLGLGNTRTLSATRYFEDPDDDQLSFTAYSSDPGVVAAQVSGTRITLSAVAVGSATLTIIAEDSGGQTAAASFAVTVSAGGGTNRPPLPVGDILSQDLREGDRMMVEISPYFEDPDHDELAYSAESSDIRVVEATTSGSEVEVEVVSEGTATVTVTAEDPGGLETSQSFEVTVREAGTGNRAPAVLGTIAAQSLAKEETSSLDLSAYFTDPDDDELAFSVVSSNTGVITATIVGTVVELQAVSEGTATVTVTAEDPGGLETGQSFEVTVREAGTGNRAPYLAGSGFPALTLRKEKTTSVHVVPFFNDPDHDQLTFSAASSNTGIVTAAFSDGIVVLEAVDVGTATVTVTATDPGGLSASTGFEVTVTGAANRPPRVVRQPEPFTFVVGAEEIGAVYFHIEDPDDARRDLDYAVTSSAPEVMRAWMLPIPRGFDAPSFRMRAIAEGTATITMTATDPDGLSASVSVVHTVGNNPPVAYNPPGDVVLQPDSTFSRFLGPFFVFHEAGIFRDYDIGDSMTFEVSTSNESVATVTIGSAIGPYLEVTGVSRGTATISATATDKGGLSTTVTFGVTVKRP